MCGYIKLFRSLKDWEWYDDHNATRLLIHLLISVNYKDKKWRGEIIKKGSMVLSWQTLSDGCGLTVQQCRTAMDKLIQSGEVTRKVTNKYQVVSLVKWEDMQIEILNAAGNLTDKQQTNNKQITTTKEGKESKERKNISRRFTPPTQNEVKNYFLEKGLSEEKSRVESEKFYDFYESKGWLVGRVKMKDWKAAVRNWLKRLSEYKEKSSAKKEKTVGQMLREKHGIESN